MHAKMFGVSSSTFKPPMVHPSPARPLTVYAFVVLGDGGKCLVDYNVLSVRGSPCGLPNASFCRPREWQSRSPDCSVGSGSQIAATALAKSSRTWPATACRAELLIACIEASGSIALTSTPPVTSRRMTLHGNIAPTRGSNPIA